MKIRNGFVSNSSSSSFILTFSSPIETFEDLCKELDIENIPGWDEEDTENLIKVFRDICWNRLEMDIEEFYYNIEDYVDDEYPFMEKSCKELYEEFKNTKIRISYGDESGDGRMEAFMWVLTKVINDENKIKGINEH